MPITLQREIEMAVALPASLENCYCEPRHLNTQLDYSFYDCDLFRIEIYSIIHKLMLIKMLPVFALTISLIPMGTVLAQVANNQPILIGDISMDAIAHPAEDRVLYFQSWRDNQAWSSRIMSSELMENSATGMYQLYKVDIRTTIDSPEGASEEASTYEVACSDGIAGSVVDQNGHTVRIRGDVSLPSNTEIGAYALHRMVCLGSAPDWAL